MIKQYDNEWIQRQLWKKIGDKLPMTIPWDDIKEGKTYHIPPIIDKHRCDIKVVGKNEYWIRVRYLNTNEIHFDYLYRYDIETKFFVEATN